jgi:PAS domain S-box-containing protein
MDKKTPVFSIAQMPEEIEATPATDTYASGSEDWYRRIVEELTDPIFVLNSSGYFMELNKSGRTLFGFSRREAKALNFFELFQEKGKAERFIHEIIESGNINNFKVRLKTRTGKGLNCIISANCTLRERGGIMRIKGTLRDVSHQKETENLMIRTIIDTQEKERKRFAMDLHDSLGQQLSAIKFYLATLKSAYVVSDPQTMETLLKSNEAIDIVLAELGNICFNLMPGTLYTFGLRQALQELCKKMEMDSPIHFVLKLDSGADNLEKRMEVDVFRVIQEFIHNAIRHGHARSVSIEINRLCQVPDDDQLRITLTDDGTGFAVTADGRQGGMGLRNVQSRIESYDGEFSLQSNPGRGTRYVIQIPLIINDSKDQY